MELTSQLGPEGGLRTRPTPCLQSNVPLVKRPCFMDRSRDRRLATIGKYPGCDILNSFEERSACHALHIPFLRTTTVRTSRPNWKLDCTLFWRVIDLRQGQWIRDDPIPWDDASNSIPPACIHMYCTNSGFLGGQAKTRTSAKGNSCS
jgi:hypothetical protein